MVFLPTRHTQLDVARPIETRRHFIEFFIWMPYEGQPAWTLTWFVYEVVGVDVLPVPGDGSVVTAVGPEPPTSFPTDDVARIVVNADGDVARLVFGTNPRSVLVPHKGLP